MVAITWSESKAPVNEGDTETPKIDQLAQKYTNLQIPIPCIGASKCQILSE